MARRRVAYLVYAFHYRVERGVVAYGGVRAEKVVVDGSRKSDDRKGELIAEDSRPGERAVAAYHHEGVYPVAAQHVVGALPPFRSGELLAACGLEYGAAALYDVADVLRGELLDFIGDEAAVASVDAVDAEACEDACAGYRAYRRVKLPGASPPEVRMPIDFMLVMTLKNL